MFERFASTARAAVEDARYEAARRGDRRLGSEHLCIALLADDTIADAAGADAAMARASMDRLDREALAAVGLHLDGFAPANQGGIGKRAMPLTVGAKSVLQQSLVRAAQERSRVITARHLMLAVLDRDAPDPAAALIADLEIDRTATRERLARVSAQPS